jgi:two-component system sensor histidine kinase BaeS
LGRRLVLAFSLVSLVAVVLLTVAARMAVDRGLQVAQAGSQSQVAQQVAELAATAYAGAAGWASADLTGALAAGTDAGYAVLVTDLDGTAVASTLRGQGRGVAGGGTTAEVLVDGTAVGSTWVGQRGAVANGAVSAQDRGRQVAWSWLVVASVLALAVAVLAGWWMTRWLTAPLGGLAAVARAFARGRRDVRADESAAGELGELARGFNEAAEAVERSAAARRQMAADVAHELRTPLAALQAGLEELRDGLLPADPQTLGRLHDQSVRLGRVVGDLALLSQVDDAAPAPLIGRLDLALVVADELAARMPELRAAGLTVGRRIDGTAPVLGDADRLHQVVGNLLANCARHCRPGDGVQVTVGCQGEDVVLAVQDTGPGIEPADQARVFDRYWRAGDVGVPGSGLGLAVVREIVEAHRGTVEVASQPGSGTTMTVRLPLATV